MRRQHIVNDIVELGHTALQLDSIEEFKTEILCQLEQTFRSPTSVFLDWEHGGREERSWKEEDLHFPHWDASFKNLYYHSLRYQDPMFNWLDSGGFIENQSVTRLTNLVRLKDFNKSLLYTELLQPLHCQYILTIALNCGPTLVANLSLMRPSNSKDYDPAEVTAARLAAPMLSGAYKRLLLMEQLAGKADLIDLVAHTHSQDALLVLSVSLEPVFYSEPLKQLANTLLDHGTDDIRDILFRSETVARYFRRFSEASEGNRRQLPAGLSETISLEDGTAIDVKLCFTPQGSGASYLRVYFQLNDSADGRGAREARNQLSMRELQIAQVLAEGHSAQQVAEKLCISPWTVKNHLKKIYAKIQVNDRASLARAIDKLQR